MHQGASVPARNSPHLRAALQALLVTLLWSTSWVLIKIGLRDIPALTFAGLRYTLAFAALLPFFARSRQATPLRALSRRDWLALAGLGLLYYTLTQGSQFLGLAYLPATNFSLLLNSTAIIVTLLGIPLLGERPGWMQWAGVAVFAAGALVFFTPLAIPPGQAIGYLIAAIHILSTSLSTVFGRGVNRGGRLHPLTVTTVSMGIGGLALLFTGLIIEPLPRLDWTGWGIVAWLAVVNTAFAFTLWNHTQRTLSAMESSIINNTMLIQTAALAWVFLGEALTGVQIAGLALAAAGALVVQLRRNGGRSRMVH
jgi:drug/metabolite transporter (DMT)-like permease